MSIDGRAVTAPSTPNGRYRLRTHELAPVLLPRPRAAPTSPTASKADDLTAVVPPARPRESIVGVGVNPRRRAVLESVAFKPFSNSESFKLLLQHPEASRKRREDPRAVDEFRQWLSHHFPQLLRTLRSLHVINSQQTILQKALNTLVVDNEQSANQSNTQQERFDEADEKETSDSEDFESKADSEASWRLMLQHATVLSAVPGEVIINQSITRSESVYFLLNRQCELSFRPVLLKDCKVPSTPSSLPRMPAALRSNDRPVIHLRELAGGDCFGLDAAAFGFNCMLSTATAGNARQRNFLGLREVALTYVLCLPYEIIQQLQMLQRRCRTGYDRLPPAFPYSFSPEAEVFLSNTFLFRAMADSSRRFLAAHLRPVVVARQEYLFTPGQPVQLFIVITGQLTLGAPCKERACGRHDADLELELLQAHDSVGLAEVMRMAASFERYCVVTSANGVRAYALSSTVLLMVLAQEAASLGLIHEWISHRKSWFELRKATALAQRKKHTAEGSEHVVRLTLAAQRRSKLTCSRCGWAGHVSTSAACVRVDIPLNISAKSSKAQRGRKSRESTRASREQARRSQTSRQSESNEVIPQLLSTSPTSPPRTPAHRRVQVDLMALRALQISKVSGVERYYSNGLDGNDSESLVEQRTNRRFKTDKEDEMRSCAVAQSRQRLVVALHHTNTQQERI
ncbi:unnamed protein product [Phytophthora lilii]|uniref:Unnamed protein product n=1 Tax=Phytophthora lilii TaxID=2077276 RepID=A0A9W6TGE6_9STRA|nr:unnamed protein product [Phytophthora lilii]